MLALAGQSGLLHIGWLLFKAVHMLSLFWDREDFVNTPNEEAHDGADRE